VWFGVLTMAQLLSVALLVGVAKVFFSTAYRAYLPTLVGPDDLVEANSRLMAAESAAQVGGPGLGGLLAQTLGAANGLLADAASFVVSLLCLRRIEAHEEPVTAARRRLRQEIGDGVRFVARDRLLRILIVFGGAANLVLTGYSAIAVAFLVRGIGLSAGSAGLLMAIGSLGGVAGAFAAPTLVRVVGSARALLICKVGATPFGLLIPLAEPGWRIVFYPLGAVGLVAGIVAGNVISGGFMQAYCPRELMGRVSTAMQVVNYGSIPIGAVLGGVLADSAGFTSALWLLMGSWVLTSTILFTAAALRQRDLPTRAGSEVVDRAAEAS
jgi:Na+/melibiose symporter-like transporter